MAAVWLVRPGHSCGIGSGGGHRGAALGVDPGDTAAAWFGARLCRAQRGGDGACGRTHGRHLRAIDWYGIFFKTGAYRRPVAALISARQTKPRILSMPDTTGPIDFKP